MSILEKVLKRPYESSDEENEVEIPPNDTGAALDEVIREQENLLDFYKSCIRENFSDPEQLTEILEYNSQDIPVGVDKV